MKSFTCIQRQVILHQNRHASTTLLPSKTLSRRPSYLTPNPQSLTTKTHFHNSTKPRKPKALSPLSTSKSTPLNKLTLLTKILQCHTIDEFLLLLNQYNPTLASHFSTLKLVRKCELKEMYLLGFTEEEIAARISKMERKVCRNAKLLIFRWQVFMFAVAFFGCLVLEMRRLWPGEEERFSDLRVELGREKGEREV